MIGDDSDLPKSVSDGWPGIFNEVTVNRLPIPYLRCIIITFVDGTEWCINTTNNDKRNPSFKASIYEFIDTYQDKIDNISVKVNTKKLKNDVKKAITNLLRKLKL
jgi:hypothetical protein